MKSFITLCLSICLCCILLTTWFGFATYKHGQENQELKQQVNRLVEQKTIYYIELNKCRGQQIEALKNAKK